MSDFMCHTLLAQKDEPLLRQISNIDSNGEDSHINERVFELNALGKGFEGEDATAGLSEMTRVVVRLESDEI